MKYPKMKVKGKGKKMKDKMCKKCKMGMSKCGCNRKGY
jgi:hypothetical protein